MFGKLAGAALAVVALPQSCVQMNTPNLVDTGISAAVYPSLDFDDPFGFKAGVRLADPDPPPANNDLPPEPDGHQDPS